MKRLLVILTYSLCLCHSGQAGTDFKANFGKVDETNVLRLGSLKLSQHIVEKNLWEYLHGEPQAHDRLVKKDSALEEWIQSFIDSRLIVHEGLNAGFHRSRETLRNLDIMERHLMLSPSSEGYRRLITKLLGEDKLETRLRHTAKQKTALVLKLDESGIRTFLSLLPQHEPMELIILPEWFEEKEDLKLGTYKNAEGSLSTFTIEEFVERYNKRIFREFPDNLEIVGSMIEEWLLEDLNYTEALSLGIDQDPKFRQDRMNYIHKLVHSQYLQNVLTVEIKVTTEDIENYYQENGQQLLTFESCQLEIDLFKDKRKAIQARFQMSQPNIETPKPSNILFVGFSPKNDINTPAIVREWALRLPVGQYSPPLDWENEYAIIRKVGQSGSYLPPLENLLEQIRAILIEEKSEIAERELVKELHREIEIIDTIDRTRLMKLINDAGSS